MDVLQSMDMNQFIIFAPTTLVVLYVVITLQKKLSNGRNPHYGLIIPVVFFVIATILAFKPLFSVGVSEEGMLGAALIVWMTFNIPSIALLFPYLVALKNRKEAAYLAAAAEARTKAEAAAAENAPEDSADETIADA